MQVTFLEAMNYIRLKYLTVFTILLQNLISYGKIISPFQFAFFLPMLNTFSPHLPQPFLMNLTILSISDNHSNLLYGSVLPAMPSATCKVLNIKPK